MKKTKFPQGFLFGGATAAYQVEGAVNLDGRGKNVWDDFYHRPESTFNADIASDFYHLYEADLKMAQAKGINAIRISITWSRIFPDNTKQVNWLGVKFYHDLIDACYQYGIEPIVTLHHFDSPQWIVDNGDWLAKSTIDHFYDYSKFCFQEYGNKVKKWVTLNEPYVYNSDKYIYGECPPLEKGHVEKAIQGMYNMMVSHAKVVKLYHDLKLNGEVGIVHVLQPKYPYDETNQGDIKAAHRANILYSQFMLELNYQGVNSNETMDVINDLLNIYDGKLLTNPSDELDFKNGVGLTDFLGINYYNPTWFTSYDGPTIISHNSDGSKGASEFLLQGLGAAKTPSSIPTTDWDWAIYPQGLYDIMQWVKDKFPNYQKIYVTENGIGVKEELDLKNKLVDHYRIDFINDHLTWILRAINSGINVQGYFVWSLQDMFSWTNGYNKRYGLFYVDFTTQQRIDKLSAWWFKAVVEQNCLDVDLTSLEQNYLTS